MKTQFPLAAALAFAVALALPSLSIAEDTPAPQPAAAEREMPPIAGLDNDKQKAGYMIGLSIARSLENVKDEIDTEALTNALRTSLSGGKVLMTDAQVQQVNEVFGQRMQSKMMAKRAEEAKKNLEAGDRFLAENGKKSGVRTTESGLQYQVMRAGNGAKPTAADTVRVHYRGTLLDGTEFDSSYARNQPAEFPLGNVIPGWTEGVALMPVGSKYKLWIPSALGYGEAGGGAMIPPNATLVFEVELLDIVK